MTLMQRLRGFARATGGLAALEFAILAPMMVFLLFGSVELIDMLAVNRRVQNTAASLADVISRDTEVSNSEMSGLWDATDTLMYPEPDTGMQIRVTSILIEDSSTARVVWSEGHGGMGGLAVNSTYPLPAAMMRPGTSVIMTETSFPYTSPLGLLVAGSVNMTHTAYRRSRLVDPIQRVA
jgi:Flp pilus assembly protein TadG